MDEIFVFDKGKGSLTAFPLRSINIIQGRSPSETFSEGKYITHSEGMNITARKGNITHSEAMNITS